MTGRAKDPGDAGRHWKEVSTFLIVLVVFGMVALLVGLGVEPLAATGLVATTSLVAAELVRRVRKSMEDSHKKKEIRGSGKR